MAKRSLQRVRADFESTLRESRRLVADAEQWHSRGLVPRMSSHRRDSLVEWAFFRVYLGWESLLEESFMLYASGASTPGRRAPKRFVFPKNRRATMDWVVPEGRPYAKWDADTVSKRAERFFSSGYTFTAGLRGQQNVLDETRKIRNVIAHDSEAARSRFESVVRNRLGTLPARATVGSFLSTVVPGANPPIVFLELYLSKFEDLVGRIVPG